MEWVYLSHFKGFQYDNMLTQLHAIRSKYLLDYQKDIILTAFLTFKDVKFITGDITILSLVTLLVRWWDNNTHTASYFT